ncbi:MAG TPA: hypothetical protein VN948_06630 [Terriglobales bacterium]|nr:hypothetical protein [Terriglobales bacterium]
MWHKLKKAWAAWKRIAHKIGDFQARVLLTLIYAVFLLPFGLIMRCFSDPLATKKRTSQWQDHPRQGADMEWARHQG